MYRIYADNQTLHHPNRFPDNFIVADPTMTEEVNAHGSLSFLLPPDNPRYNSLRKLKTIVTVMDDDGLAWRGRVVNETQTLKRLKKVYCEGELAFLCDSIVRPYVHRGSVSSLFSYLITNHNSQVDTSRQFTVGNVTVEDANEYIVRSISSPLNTWAAVKQWLLDKLGGYIFLRHQGSVTYIDYLAQMPQRETQMIEWGKNIVDISEAITAESVITCLIPYGAQFADDDPAHEDEPQSGAWDGNRLTIKSVNGGLDYIENQTGIDIYGRVWGSNTWDDVTIASNLKTKGTAYLQNQIRAACTITVSAVDLHMVERDVPALHIGDEVPVKSSVHGINTTLICRKKVLPLMNLSKAKITLGASMPEITDRG